MLRLRIPSHNAVLSIYARYVTSRKYSSGSNNPLRILFCGSDEFSAASLKRLHAEHLKNKGLISSINVVCRTGKPAGRGLKKIREGMLFRHLTKSLTRVKARKFH